MRIGGIFDGGEGLCITSLRCRDDAACIDFKIVKREINGGENGRHLEEIELPRQSRELGRDGGQIAIEAANSYGVCGGVGIEEGTENDDFIRIGTDERRVKGGGAGISGILKSLRGAEG